MSTNNLRISLAIEDVLSEVGTLQNRLRDAFVGETFLPDNIALMLDRLKVILIEWLGAISEFPENIATMRIVYLVQSPANFEDVTCASLLDINLRLHRIETTLLSRRASGVEGDLVRMEPAFTLLRELAQCVRVTADRTSAWFRLMRGEEIHRECIEADVADEHAIIRRLDERKRLRGAVAVAFHAMGRVQHLREIQQTGMNLPPGAPPSMTFRSVFAQ